MLLRLAISQMLYNAIYQFSNLFINTYLFRVSHSERTTGVYNLILFIAWGLFFYAGFMLCERNTRLGLRLSGVCALIGMALLLTGSASPLLLGLFMGASGGLFYSSYLSIYRTMGKASEQGKTYARISILGSLPNVFVPLLMGLLVEGKGYAAGFITLACLAVGVFATSFTLPAFRTEKVVLRKATLAHFRFTLGNALQGVYSSFVGIAAGLMVFMAGEGEAKVGMLATFYGVLTLGVNVLSGYLIPNRYNRLMLLLGALVYLGSAFLFVTDWPTRIILFNFLIAAANPLFNNSSLGIHFSYINHAFPNGSEGIVSRELGLSFGRMFFFMYMSGVGLNASSGSFYVLLFTVSLFPLLVFALIRKLDGASVPGQPGGSTEADAKARAKGKLENAVTGR